MRGNFQRPGALLKKDPFFHTLRAFLDAYDALCHKIAPSHKKVVTYAECVSRDCHLKDNQIIGHDWLSTMNKIFLAFFYLALNVSNFIILNLKEEELVFLCFELKYGSFVFTFALNFDQF